MRKRLMGFVTNHLRGEKTVRNGKLRRRLIRYLSAKEGVECAEDGYLGVCICSRSCITWNCNISGVR